MDQTMGWKILPRGALVFWFRCAPVTQRLRLVCLIVSDLTTQQASRLIGSQWVAATRGMTTASIGEFARPKPRSDRVSFTELGLAPALAEVFGRADVTVAIDMRALPAGSRAERLALDVMVAPDSAGERAVVSVFVNERLLGSVVAMKYWHKPSTDANLDGKEALQRYGFYLCESSRDAGIDFIHQAPTLDAKLEHIMPIIASMGAACIRF